jgi:hypothetical protein
MTQKEKNHTLIRILYNVMLLINCLDKFKGTSINFEDKESYKVISLILIRNLNDFLLKEPSYSKKHKKRIHDDDTWVEDFNLNNWHPNKKARLDLNTKYNIHKIAGHIVTGIHKNETSPFKNTEHISKGRFEPIFT